MNFEKEKWLNKIVFDKRNFFIEGLGVNYIKFYVEGICFYKDEQEIKDIKFYDLCIFTKDEIERKGFNELFLFKKELCERSVRRRIENFIDNKNYEITDIQIFKCPNVPLLDEKDQGGLRC